MVVLGLGCCWSFPWLQHTGAALLVACGLLAAVVPLVAEHRLQSVGASVAGAHGP